MKLVLRSLSLLLIVGLPATYADSSAPEPSSSYEELTYEQVYRTSPDYDGDGLRNVEDNCTFVANPDQTDTNSDGIGDACEASLFVTIDILPGDDLNVIVLESNGVLPVAILSSKESDVLSINPASIAVSGDEVGLTGKADHYLCQEKDVNQDGLADLKCDMVIAEFLLVPGSSEVELEGMTRSFVGVAGFDRIEVVDGKSQEKLQ